MASKKTKSFYLTWEAELGVNITIAANTLPPGRLLKGNMLLRDIPLPLMYETLEQVKLEIAHKIITELKFGKVNWITITFVMEIDYHESKILESPAAAIPIA